MATTDLKLDEPGSLPKPGPVGRTVRLVLGAMCTWQVHGLLDVTQNLLASSGHIRSVIWVGGVAGLFLISYVVNIGYSRDWKKRPVFAIAGVSTVLAVIGYLTQGSVETELLARIIWGWELYLFAHLGLAFVIAGVIGTPGCEMRAFHDLYSRITGTPTKEHHCPIGPLHPIDQWESRRIKR